MGKSNGFEAQLMIQQKWSGIKGSKQRNGEPEGSCQLLSETGYEAWWILDLTWSLKFLC